MLTKTSDKLWLISSVEEPYKEMPCLQWPWQSKKMLNIWKLLIWCYNCWQYKYLPSKQYKGPSVSNRVGARDNCMFKNKENPHVSKSHAVHNSSQYRSHSPYHHRHSGKRSERACLWSKRPRSSNCLCCHVYFCHQLCTDAPSSKEKKIMQNVGFHL